jgi:hypothetical protein
MIFPWQVETKAGWIALVLVLTNNCLRYRSAVALLHIGPSAANNAVVDASRRSILESGVSTSLTLSSMSPTDPLVGRRPATNVVETIGSYDPGPFLQSQLARSRIGSEAIKPFQQRLTNFDKELYYAPFLFGSWNTTATLKRKIYPFGRHYLPSQSLYEGSPRNRDEKVGNSVSYETHYFSTIANTMQNQLTVNLGTGVPSTRIIQDRGYNAVSISNAYQQMTPVEHVTWNYSNDPERLTLDFAAGLMAEDMRPLGPRRTELYIPARDSETVSDTVFACAERTRSVSVGTGSVVVSDMEILSEFHLVNENEIQAVSRIAVFLTPNPNSREGILWQQVGGQAVGLFDYEVSMRRMVNESGVACVVTPKDVAQCVSSVSIS